MKPLCPGVQGNGKTELQTGFPKMNVCAAPQSLASVHKHRLHTRGTSAENPRTPFPLWSCNSRGARSQATSCSWHSGAGLAWPLSPLEDLLQQGILTSRERPAHQEGRWLLTGMFLLLRARREMPGPRGGAEYVTQVQKPESTVLAVGLAREPQSEHARDEHPNGKGRDGEGGLTAGSPLMTGNPELLHRTNRPGVGPSWP